MPSGFGSDFGGFSSAGLPPTSAFGAGMSPSATFGGTDFARFMPWLSQPGFSSAFQTPGGGVVLGVTEGPGTYGDAEGGRPTPQEREVMSWVNALRMAPTAFDGALSVKGCSSRDFRPDERKPVPPLRLNHDLALASARHALDLSENDFVSHVGSDGSSPFDRMDRVDYKDGFRGENVAAGMFSGFDVVTAWACSPGHRENLLSPDFSEFAVAQSSKFGTRHTHYSVANFGGPGQVRGGQFQAEAAPRSGIVMGSHSPEEPGTTDEVTFSADFHSTAGVPPEALAVVLNGASFPMNLVRGEPQEGSYAVTIQLGSLQQEGTGSNWWVAQTPCMQYHFEVLPAAGTAPEGAFPERGSYGFGGCVWDDPIAKWASQRAASAPIQGLQGRNPTTPPRRKETPHRPAPVRAAAAHTPRSRLAPGPPRTVCPPDVITCADGSIAHRVPPACQVYCPEGAVPPPPPPGGVETGSELAELSPELEAFLDPEGCARTWTDFFGGLWRWCDDVLAKAERDESNPWRAIIPMWRELQAVDWVAAVSSMSNLWQNLEQCRVYEGGPGESLRAGIAASGVLVEPGTSLESVRRVAVRVDLDSSVSEAAAQSMDIWLSQRPAAFSEASGLEVGEAAVRVPLFIGAQSGPEHPLLRSADSPRGVSTGRSVFFDDYAAAPLPGWWGVWTPTEAEQGRAGKHGSSGHAHRVLLDADGARPGVAAPALALSAFTPSGGAPESPGSSGVWALSVHQRGQLPANNRLVQPAGGADPSLGLKGWKLWVCGEPLQSDYSFSGQSWLGEDCTLQPGHAPECDAVGCRANRAAHFCGAISTVGSHSVQPPPRRNPGRTRCHAWSTSAGFPRCSPSTNRPQPAPARGSQFRWKFSPSRACGGPGSTSASTSLLWTRTTAPTSGGWWPSPTCPSQAQKVSSVRCPPSCATAASSGSSRGSRVAGPSTPGSVRVEKCSR